MNSSSARDIIFNLFREAAGGFVSGAAISRELGVSRSAVWKQIESLRQLGYRIDALPSRGYRLASRPDCLFPEEVQSGLDTERIGLVLHYETVLDSTNAKAYSLGEQGGIEGTVVIADQQTAGKGRMGRSWTSPPGVNLYASVVLRPDILPWDAPQLTFLSAVATCRAIYDVTSLKATVKWPNDILVNSRKVAGLLNEMSSETDRVNFVVLGMGVNINMTRDQFPVELRYPATSLALETGRLVSRVDFTRCLLSHLDQLYRVYRAEGSGPVLAAWAELSELVGRMVSVDCQNKVVTGRVKGFGQEGALLLETEDGHMQRLLAGDVRLV